MRFTTTFIAVLCAVALCGCEALLVSHSEKPAPPPYPQIEFIVAEGTLGEPYESDPGIFFGTRTTRHYGCVNVLIPTTVIHNDSHIFIQLGEPELAGDYCFTATGPAKGRARLDITPGVYTLHIQWKQWRETAELRVTENSITVTSSDPVFSVIPTKTVMRFTERSLLFRCLDQDSLGETCDSLTADLVNVFALEEIVYPSDDVRPFMLSGRYFKYPLGTDVDSIRRHLSNFTYANPFFNMMLIDWRSDPGRALMWNGG